MKTIFSTATLIAVLAALASAAPTKLAARTVLSTIAADFTIVIDQANPNTFYGASSPAIIERTNGNNEKDTLISFTIPPFTSIPGASASSTCQLVITDPSTVTGSGETQIFSLGGPITSTSTESFNEHPFFNQYFGTQSVVENGNSIPIDVSSFPCNFGSDLQLALRPQNDNDLIEFTQTANSGAFIVVSS
jgi:Ubiquitin 3 binding protein But2 C-terminal domain